MKGILKIILKETAFLKNTIIMVGLILILFSGAFLSVLSVRIDVPNGMYKQIDNEDIKIGCMIKNVTIKDARNECDLLYGGITGITTDLTLNGYQNKKQVINKTEMTYKDFFSTRTRGIIIGENTDFQLLQEAAKQDESILRGNLPKLAYEVLISNYIAQKLALNVNDNLVINNLNFKIVGIYDSAKYFELYKETNLPAVSYFLVMPDDTILEEAYLNFTSSKQLQLSMKNFNRKGYNPIAVEAMTKRLEIINLARAFFMSVAIVLAIVTFFVQYSLIATFFRQRKAQICRLKLLGATDGKIARVYCFIAFMITILAVTIGAFLSLLFNKYFINLCNELFEYEFISHFRAGISLITGAILIFFTLLIYRHSVRKISKFNIIEVIKHE